MSDRKVVDSRLIKGTFTYFEEITTNLLKEGYIQDGSLQIIQKLKTDYAGFWLDLRDCPTINKNEATEETIYIQRFTKYEV